MKLKLKLTPLLAVVSLSTITMSNPALADMKDLFDSYQNDTGYNHVNVAGGNNWGLGQFSARWNQPSLDIVSIQAPSASVGCGGVDMFAGSFGFISGDELVQVGRAVAQGAAAYFFKLAINNICSTCAAEMENLQNKLQRLNELARNACQNTQDLLANNEYVGEDKLIAQESLISSSVASKIGTVSSWAGSIIGNENTGEDKDIASRKIALEGNAVYQSVSLLDSGSSVPFLQTLGFKGSDNKQKIASMLMTLIGTKVLKFQDGVVDVDAEPSFNITSPANFEEFIIGTEPVNIDLKSCGPKHSSTAEFRCLNVQTEQVSFNPLEKVILDKMVGSDADKGVLRKYMTKTPLDNDDKEFVQAFNFPYVKWAVFAQDNNINIDDIARFAAYSLIISINNEIFNQVTKVHSLASSTKESVYESGTSFKADFTKGYLAFAKQYETVNRQLNEKVAKNSENLSTVVQIAALTKLAKG